MPAFVEHARNIGVRVLGDNSEECGRSTPLPVKAQQSTVVSRSTRGEHNVGAWIDTRERFFAIGIGAWGWSTLCEHS